MPAQHSGQKPATTAAQVALRALPPQYAVPLKTAERAVRVVRRRPGWLLAAAFIMVPGFAGWVILLMAFGFGKIPEASAGCAVGQVVPSSADVDQATIDRINALKGIYEQVGAEKGVAWSALAALDYRESTNDPNRSALSGEPVGTANPDGNGTTTSKLDSVQRSADAFKSMASGVYGVNVTATTGGPEIQNAFIAYNRGYIYKNANQPADSSPYVMNQYDAGHVDMTFPSIDGEPLAGRTEYGRYGAFTLFTRLGGSSAGGACGGVSSSDVVRIAASQIGRKEVPDGCNCGPEIQPYLGSSAGEKWCADFVSWVYREAGRPFTGGVDGGWRLPGVEGLRTWLEQNGVFEARGLGAPQPGDVIIYGGGEHTGIVDHVDGDRVHTIEGNSSDQVIRRDYALSDTYITGWGRPRA